MSTLSQFFTSGSPAEMHCAYIAEGYSSVTQIPRLEWNNGTNVGGAGTQMAVQSRDTTATINACGGLTSTGGVLYLAGAKKIVVTGSGLWSLNGSVDTYFDQTEEITQLGFLGFGTGNVTRGTSVSQRLLKTLGTFSFFTSSDGYNQTMSCVQDFTLLANINKFVFQNNGTSGTLSLLFSGCALTAASVENMLVGIDQGSRTRSAGTWTINISGGTSAGVGSLSSAALAARTSLIAKGWTVTLNP